jgi:SulP family sulfate permease
MTVPPRLRRALAGAGARRDLLAGITVTAYLVPQVMAYAELAGLPAAAGLWASVGALLVYAALGSSPQLSVGPESTTALMAAAALTATGAARWDQAVALAILVALVCVAGWAAGLSQLAALLSRPVLVGYMAGIAVVLVLSQLAKLAGADAPGDITGPGWLLRHLDEVHVPTLVVGMVTLTVMLVGSALWPRAPMALIGMVASTIAVAVLDLQDRGVAVIGHVPSGPPVPAIPDLGVADVVSLVPAALAVAFVGYSDNILDARAFAARQGDKIDARRELLALGGCNLGAAVLHGMPVSSSGSRTAICVAMGGRTRLAGLVTAVATAFSILLLAPALALFPRAALGAVVVYAATRLVDVPEFRRIARFRRSELLIAVATTAAVVVVGVLQGVLIAIGLSLLDLLRRVARPHDAVEGYVPGLAGMHDVDDYPSAEVVPGLLVYRYDSPLFFANADDFLTRALAAVDASRVPVRWFVLNTEAIVEVDITAADALEELRSTLVQRGIVVALARVKRDLADDLEPSGLLDRIGPDRVFPTLPTAVEAFRRWAGTTTGEAAD